MTTTLAPATDAYFGLLTNPPGFYGLTSYGSTHAITLTGCPEFRRRAYNLFTSFDGGAIRSDMAESRLPELHASERPDTVWFCLPKHRVRAALALFFYCQLWSGGKVAQEWVSSGRVNEDDSGAGYYFVTAADHKMIRVQGAVSVVEIE